MTRTVRAECDFGGLARGDVLVNADAQVTLKPGSSPLNESKRPRTPVFPESHPAFRSGLPRQSAQSWEITTVLHMSVRAQSVKNGARSPVLAVGVGSTEPGSTDVRVLQKRDGLRSSDRRAPPKAKWHSSLGFPRTVGTVQKGPFSGNI